VAGWQAAQAAVPLPATAGWPLSSGGGTPWQVPQATSEPSTFVQSGAVLEPPASAPPWQYVPAQRAPSHDGAVPFALASGPNTTSAGPPSA
jgi:hypothetical protein